MSEKKYKSISIDIETFNELDDFCSIANITKSNFIRAMLLFMKSNKSLITADFFQKSDKNKKETFFSANEKLQSDIEKITSKSMKKEINRVIAFLKVQDKFLSEMKQDFFAKIDKDNLGEYHPLFRHMDLVLGDIEDYLEANGKSLNNVYDFLKEKVGEQRAEPFLRSLKNIQEKTLKY